MMQPLDLQHYGDARHTASILARLAASKRPASAGGARTKTRTSSTGGAEARGESKEETEERRKKELEVEESEEAKEERELIGKALGSVMG